MKVHYLYLINAIIILSFVGLEVLYCCFFKKAFYKFNDTITSLSSYFSADIFNLFMQIPVLLFFKYIEDNYRLVELSEKSLLNFFICLILVDFIYYWWHRYSHRIKILWGFHIIHHQSKEYNLAVGVRKGWFTKATFAFFYLPLVFIFSIKMILLASALLALYQFFLHVRFIGKLGFIEKVMCTPSHHRVHHGMDEKYLGKNYAGIFIIWDKLFGTFQEEQEEPNYGLPEQLNSQSLLWINFHYWYEVFQASTSAKLIDKIKTFFMPLEYLPTKTITLKDEVSLNTSITYKIAITLCLFIAISLDIYMADNFDRFYGIKLIILGIITTLAFIITCSLYKFTSFINKNSKVS